MILTIIEYGGVSRQIECEFFEFRCNQVTNWIEVRKADGNKELIHNICVIKTRAESEKGRYIDADKLYKKMLDLQGTKRERYLDIDEVRKIIKNEKPAEDVVSIKEIINEIDELYYDFEKSDGNLTTFIIDGEILHTDVGYAIVGIEFYKNILKKRIGKYCGAKMEEAEEK